jgi:hypothetical protein
VWALCSYAAFAQQHVTLAPAASELALQVRQLCLLYWCFTGAPWASARALVPNAVTQYTSFTSTKIQALMLKASSLALQHALDLEPTSSRALVAYAELLLTSGAPDERELAGPTAC